MIYRIRAVGGRTLGILEGPAEFNFTAFIKELGLTHGDYGDLINELLFAGFRRIEMREITIDLGED